MLFVHPSNLSRYAQNINGSPISLRKTQEDLGPIISTDLSWINYYNNIAAKACQQLGLLQQTFDKLLPSMQLRKKFMYLWLDQNFSILQA